VSSEVGSDAYPRERCRELVERVVGLSRADEVHVSLGVEDLAHQRFARNSPSTAGLVSTSSLSVRSTFGRRSATSEGNQLDPGSLEILVRRSEELARSAPEDPELLPALGPQEFLQVDTAPAESEAERLEQLVRGVSACIGRARRAGCVAAGFAQSRERVAAVGNSRGLFGYQRLADAQFSGTVRTPDGAGSGWASTAGVRARDLDFEGPSLIAIDKARSSVEARSWDPGEYPVVLEPSCVARLMGLFMGQMGMRAADEGHSFFSLPGGRTRLGEELFAGSVQLGSDPSDAAVPSLPWSAEGVPHAPTRWLEGGVVRNLHCDRYWAREHARPLVPRPPNLLLEGGPGSLEELIEGTERGLLVTNLWYVRSVDPRSMLYTGLTRDGLFWIEDGRVTHPVNNFRWNESPVRVLQNVEALSRPERIAGRNGRALQARVPGMRVSSFRFTSVSDAV